MRKAVGLDIQKLTSSSLMNLLLTLLLFTTSVSADIYLHNPRGSNNRVDEKTATRKTNNRLFDSQNNNRGGYNVGDVGNEPAAGNADLQYQMKYFQSSPAIETILDVEWTNQHGCGGSRREVVCNIILQYMCQDQTQLKDALDELRDGTSTTIQDYTVSDKTETVAESKARKSGDVKTDRGLHENWDFYNKCYLRDRNRGLFIADVNVVENKKSATVTRQNPKGIRNGYECPEERDYFPYWHPNPWRDIAILTDMPWRCKILQKESFNVVVRHECVLAGSRFEGSKWNNQYDCSRNGGVWTAFNSYLEKALEFKDRSSCESQVVSGNPSQQYVWGLPYDVDGKTRECLVPLPLPDCGAAPWSRANHLGNSIRGVPPHYEWKLPHFPSERRQKCVLRVRYNISTTDYDPIKTDWKSNQNKSAGVWSPINKNPIVKIWSSPLRLAINTQQTGRTFQDRSHSFWLIPRPKSLYNQRIFNLNVRGKRGNIVQVYPAVEYDFVPKESKILSTDLVHIQWTGSNTHNNNAPGGDGDTGAAGEGTAGTDRSNFVMLSTLGQNFPSAFEKSDFWKGLEIKWNYFGNLNMSSLDLALNFASAGYYRCASNLTCEQKYAFTHKEKLNPVLNNAPASFEGILR
uniref:Uncharacterized protein n=1 Tax=Strigamia maritima TaxID=126957 RepID=T1JCE1_STRMM